MALRILLAEDEQIVRQGVRALLEQAGFQVVGEAADGREAVELAAGLHPDVVILDLAMPNLNGLSAATQFRQACPGARLVALTASSGEEQVLAALHAGIKGYVLKTQASADLVQAILEVSHGRTYLSPGVSQTVVDAFLARREGPPDPLTPREKEVLQLIAEGRTTKEVAHILGISVKTAEFHRTRIMAKLAVHETAGLVRYAVRKGLIQP